MKRAIVILTCLLCAVVIVPLAFIECWLREFLDWADWALWRLERWGKR